MDSCLTTELVEPLTLDNPLMEQNRELAVFLCCSASLCWQCWRNLTFKSPNSLMCDCVKLLLASQPVCILLLLFPLLSLFSSLMRHLQNNFLSILNQKWHLTLHQSDFGLIRRDDVSWQSSRFCPWSLCRYSADKVLIISPHTTTAFKQWRLQNDTLYHQYLSH